MNDGASYGHASCATHRAPAISGSPLIDLRSGTTVSGIIDGMGNLATSALVTIVTTNED